MVFFHCLMPEFCESLSKCAFSGDDPVCRGCSGEELAPRKARKCCDGRWFLNLIPSVECRLLKTPIKHLQSLHVAMLAYVAIHITFAAVWLCGVFDQLRCQK